MRKLTKAEEATLDMLKAEVNKTTDREKLRELNEEIIECIRGIAYRQADEDLRKEYHLPSPEAEVRNLTTQIENIERQINWKRSDIHIVKPDTYGVW
jgi:hypothetical protein